MSHLARRPLSRNSNSERLPDGCKSRSFARFDVDVAVQSLDKGVQSSFCCGLFSSCKGHFSKPCCLQGLGASCGWCSCFLPRLWRADFQSGWPWVIPFCSTITAVAIQCSPLVCCFFDEMMDIGWSWKSKIGFSLIHGNQEIFCGDLLLFLRAPLHIQWKLQYFFRTRMVLFTSRCVSFREQRWKIDLRTIDLNSISC